MPGTACSINITFCDRELKSEPKQMSKILSLLAVNHICSNLECLILPIKEAHNCRNDLRYLWIIH